MALSRRYHTWPPGEAGYIGMDFGAVVPIGRSVDYGRLSVVTNTNPTQDASASWQLHPVEHVGRQVWCWLSGGQAGIDYQFQWIVQDSWGDQWNRTVLMLCANTA
jgi:hypothetical protein